MTGTKIRTHKSCTKKNVKFTFHKFDPKVGKHVIFYETRLPKRVMIDKQKRLWRNRLIRFTGRGIKPLVEVVRKRYNAGFYSKYFNRHFYQLVDKTGRSFPYY